MVSLYRSTIIVQMNSRLCCDYCFESSICWELAHGIAESRDIASVCLAFETSFIEYSMHLLKSICCYSVMELLLYERAALASHCL